MKPYLADPDVTLYCGDLAASVQFTDAVTDGLTLGEYGIVQASPADTDSHSAADGRA